MKFSSLRIIVLQMKFSGIIKNCPRLRGYVCFAGIRSLTIQLLTITAPVMQRETIFFLNNDVTVITENWLGEMLGVCQRREVGAVGVKLIYPDDTIQHAGCVVGMGRHCRPPVCGYACKQNRVSAQSVCSSGYDGCYGCMYDDEKKRRLRRPEALRRNWQWLLMMWTSA